MGISTSSRTLAHTHTHTQHLRNTWKKKKCHHRMRPYIAIQQNNYTEISIPKAER